MINMTFTIFAQSPQAFKYQTVVRDNAGEILPNQSLSFQISLLSTLAGGIPFYTETHNTTSNEFGLVSLEIGNGIPTYGIFASLEWENDQFYLEVSMDETGGSNYSHMGTSQLLSVPYARHAETSGNDLWKKNVNDIYYNDGNVGIGYGIPDATLHVFKGSAGYVSAQGESALVVENNSTVALSILTPSINEGVIYFGDNDNHVAGGIVYNHPLDALSFRTGGNFERMRINSLGNLGIGTTDPLDKLHVQGSIRIVDGNQADGKFMVSDENGTGAWTASSSLDTATITEYNNRDPFLILNYIICFDGNWPGPPGGPNTAEPPFIGQITLFAGLFTPPGWELCEGQILNIMDYQLLYALLGTTYGGDGYTTFALPDLRGRSPVQHFNYNNTGDTGGQESIDVTDIHLK